MTIKVIEYTPIFKKGFKRAKKKHHDVTKLHLLTVRFEGKRIFYCLKYA